MIIVRRRSEGMWILLRIHRRNWKEWELYGPFWNGEDAEKYAHKLTEEGSGGTYSPMKVIEAKE